MFIVLLLASQLTTGASPASAAADCRAAERDALGRAAAAVASGRDAAAQEVLDAAAEAPAACPVLRMTALALRGWTAARQLAPAGGEVRLTGPARTAAGALDAWRGGDGALEAEYAQTAILAAIAAAQDERDELALRLVHARDLAERLAARGRAAVWPRTVNVLAGELWLEVDRYEEALNAFERAVRGGETPIARAGQARAASRLGRHRLACEAYARLAAATPVAPSLLSEARAFLAGCR